MIHMWTQGLGSIKTTYQYVQTHNTYLKFIYPAPFCLPGMPWTIDLLIDYCSDSSHEVVYQVLIWIVRASDVRDCLVIEIV